MEQEKRNEDLVAGDVVKIWGTPAWNTITKIEPYRGPLTDIVFAIAHLAGGPHRGFSLEIGGYSIVLSRHA